MRSRSFLKKYVHFLLVMMILITGAIVSVFGDFENSEAVEAKELQTNLFNAKSELGIDAKLKNAVTYKNLKVDFSKTLPRKYVSKYSKNVRFGDLVLQNTGEDYIRIEKLSFDLSNGSLANSYRLLDDAGFIADGSLSDGTLVFSALNVDLKARNTKSFYIVADMNNDALAGSRTRLRMNLAEDLSVYSNSKKLSLAQAKLHSPFVTVVGR